MTQLSLKKEPQLLDTQAWSGSFNGRESTLQQLSPYVGKLKSGMARSLIEVFSEPGDVVLDPFCGSGVVPLEALLAGRVAYANDLSPYAALLTRGKLEAPATSRTAMRHAEEVIAAIERDAPHADVSQVPQWILEFFHQDTMREIVSAFDVLRARRDSFLTACMMGILQHVRPGFLSYPASHLVPYLRKAKYPPDVFPEMYRYRDVRTRLLAKVKRAYRNAGLPSDWSRRSYEVWQRNAADLPIAAGGVDAIVSSPPYFGALDYARDNRLRLWFLGCEDWKRLDGELTASEKVYLPQMTECLREMNRVLKAGGYCILVLGDVERDGKLRRTAEILSELAALVTSGDLRTEEIHDDIIPDDRRSRRKTRTTKHERILVMRKTR
ncbi:MAG TPA: DNA methyltransferase [Thermoanaerobaculia bacterium]|jgi:SAM-dependent methyltransferase|nr:DNA methyltransferase [Thermoanaerobaculia bacterium]